MCVRWPWRKLCAACPCWVSGCNRAGSCGRGAGVYKSLTQEFQRFCLMERSVEVEHCNRVCCQSGLCCVSLSEGTETVHRGNSVPRLYPVSFWVPACLLAVAGHRMQRMLEPALVLASFATAEVQYITGHHLYCGLSLVSAVNRSPCRTVA